MDQDSLLAKVLLAERLLRCKTSYFIAEGFSPCKVISGSRPGQSDEQGIVKVISEVEVCNSVWWKHVADLNAARGNVKLGARGHVEGWGGSEPVEGFKRDAWLEWEGRPAVADC